MASSSKDSKERLSIRVQIFNWPFNRPKNLGMQISHSLFCLNLIWPWSTNGKCAEIQQIVEREETNQMVTLKGEKIPNLVSRALFWRLFPYAWLPTSCHCPFPAVLITWFLFISPVCILACAIAGCLSSARCKSVPSCRNYRSRLEMVEVSPAEPSSVVVSR